MHSCPVRIPAHTGRAALLLAAAAAVSLFAPCKAVAQMLEPVKFSAPEVRRVSPSEAVVVFSATIAPGWHVYSPDVPADGPTPASFHLSKAAGVEPVGKLEATGKRVRKMDEVFGMELEYFEKSCSFSQRLRITDRRFSASGYLEYGACGSASCMPPSQVEFRWTGSDGPAAQLSAPAAGKAEAGKPAFGTAAPRDSAATLTAAHSAALSPGSAVSQADSAMLWKPQIAALQAQNGEAGHGGGRSLPVVFLLGFLGGLLALLTPCVWPIIPMTVSFFLHRSTGSRRRAAGDAVAYGAAIVAIYLALGLAVTAIYGANAMNSLSTNAALNLLFFLMLVVFAASFLGGFDISLPSSWGNRVSAGSRSTSGIASIALMALTLVIVSFSCTGPIIGFLLVEVSSGGRIAAPAVGMLGFAVALALPFTLFALLPRAMRSLPRSGGWMDVVKVSLGFVELAFALKFLSVADLAYGWHILPREAFLALWIAIFAVLALYLLGAVGIHAPRPARASVPRVFLGLASMAFAIYMVPGLWGAPLKAVSAFAPPLSTQDFRLGARAVETPLTDYEAAMGEARRTGKPVLIDFTGHGCVNCRKMEASVWTDPAVASLLSGRFVVVSLYTDDKTPLPRPLVVRIMGKNRTLRSVGDKWSCLQQVKFGANAQPFYVAVNAKGEPLAGSYAYDENPLHFKKFLEKALRQNESGGR